MAPIGKRPRAISKTVALLYRAAIEPYSRDNRTGLPMWTRSFLWAGVLSSVAAAALTVAVLWLALLAVERASVASVGWVATLIRYWMIPGIPGAAVYALCWHRVVFRKRDYSVRNTWRLIFVSYLVAMIVGAIATLIFLVVSMLTGRGPMPPGASPWQWLVMTLTVYGFLILLFYLPAAGTLLLIPYLLVAAPVAFLQRALLLRMFGSGRPTAGAGPLAAPPMPGRPPSRDRGALSPER